MKGKGHAERAAGKARLYALVERLCDHGVTDATLIGQALKRTPQRIRQVLDDLHRKRVRHTLREMLDALPDELRGEVEAFGGRY